MRSPAASASDRRFNTTIAQPSPRTNPSAAASNVLHRPSGDRTPARAKTSVPIGDRIAFTPPASARSLSPRWRLTTAWCSATSDDEHAVSTAIAGPSRPSVNATRPIAVLWLLPVMV